MKIKEAINRAYESSLAEGLRSSAASSMRRSRSTTRRKACARSSRSASRNSATGRGTSERDKCRRLLREPSDVSADAPTIRGWLAAHRAEAEAFLAALVRQPSDNPPGDCAPHAATAAALLEAMGLHVERHPVPDEEVIGARHGVVHQPDRPRALRHGQRPDDRAECAWRRRAAGRALDRRPVRRRGARRRHVRAGRRRVQVGFRDVRLRAARVARRRPRAARRSTAPSNCTSPTTRKRAARSGRRGCSQQGLTQARFRDQCGLFLCDHHRAQRLPAPRGRGARTRRATRRSPSAASMRSKRRTRS